MDCSYRCSACPGALNGSHIIVSVRFRLIRNGSNCHCLNVRELREGLENEVACISAGYGTEVTLGVSQSTPDRTRMNTDSVSDSS